MKHVHEYTKLTCQNPGNPNFLKLLSTCKSQNNLIKASKCKDAKKDQHFPSLLILMCAKLLDDTTNKLNLNWRV